MDEATKEAIRHKARSVIKTRMDEFIDDAKMRNAPMHAAILDAFESRLAGLGLTVESTLRISSWIHGLNTSMGSFFETVGNKLSGGKKRSFKNKNKTSLKVSTSQKQTIKNIWDDLKSGSADPNPKKEMSRIMKSRSSKMQKASDFTVDVFIEREKEIIAVEMKSVRPNKGESGGEKAKILEAKTALQNAFPKKKIIYITGYPFDPTSETPTGYDKDRFMAYLIGGKNYYANEEFMIGSELWDFLSGEKNTFEKILKIIEEVVVEIKGK
ncbi:hypothetical protein A3D88_04330 [Candidatus Peribacteria bacterium RIFCSPHIGHO2_02_FULL_52_16]|nr:MAG: hypothetical protein A2706_02960 [Candidatus Peribacteria bacterium RIFCSPHIGHO2_01_FULL_51_35]OGJ60837.1 MAG: hypothetical protein A3D88_04330 [Candidatus Peribacteria bacterium RIFCSPHIGHO2_02_FULL_52_16]